MLDLQQMYAKWKQITNTNTKTLAFYRVLARGLIKHTAPTEFESPVSHPNFNHANPSTKHLHLHHTDSIHA